tara:strand:- start:3499 stop:5148 length:1650 start_codon:yes stop_codon:yes gene_type:complete
MSMKEALAKAFEKAGEKLPSSPKKRNKKRRPAKTRAHKHSVEIKADWKKDSKPVVRRQKTSVDVRATEPAKVMPQPKKPDVFEVDIGSEAAPSFLDMRSSSDYRLMFKDVSNLGGLMGSDRDSALEEELFLGLDFGTSSLKAIIGDRNRRIHYAVPFREAVGIEQYLLPTRLYQSGGTYALNGPEQPDYQNLKLDLMADPASHQARACFVAFIALALRQVGAWFHANHHATYSQSKLLWSLNLGVPAAESGRLSETIQLLGLAGWIAASAEVSITEDVLVKALCRAEELLAGLATPGPLEDVEVCTVPEIAAQIYGYVKSDAFDPNAQNLFVLADVGAGTVDCAMFKIRPHKHGEEFLFYEKSVEPLGVTSLHISRLEWFLEVFSSMQPSADVLVGATKKELMQIDASQHIPDSFGKYFRAVTVKSSPKGPLGIYNPDAEFDRRLRAQIQEDTLEKGRKSGDWHVDALKDTPFLLSGGGSRNKFYERIKKGLQHHPSLGYLRLTPRALILPSNITAPGLPRKDWDRLSVAYGLSFGSVGKATFVPAVSK